MQGAAIVTNRIKAESESIPSSPLQNFFPMSIARHAYEYTRAQIAGAEGVVNK